MAIEILTITRGPWRSPNGGCYSSRIAADYQLTLRRGKREAIVAAVLRHHRGAS